MAWIQLEDGSYYNTETEELMQPQREQVIGSGQGQFFGFNKSTADTPIIRNLFGF